MLPNILCIREKRIVNNYLSSLSNVYDVSNFNSNLLYVGVSAQTLKYPLKHHDLYQLKRSHHNVTMYVRIVKIYKKKRFVFIPRRYSAMCDSIMINISRETDH